MLWLFGGGPSTTSPRAVQPKAYLPANVTSGVPAYLASPDTKRTAFAVAGASGTASLLVTASRDEAGAYYPYCTVPNMPSTKELVKGTWDAAGTGMLLRQGMLGSLELWEDTSVLYVRIDNVSGADQRFDPLLLAFRKKVGASLSPASPAQLMKLTGAVPIPASGHVDCYVIVPAEMGTSFQLVYGSFYGTISGF